MKTFPLTRFQHTLLALCSLALCTAASHAASKSPDSLPFKAPENGFVSVGVYNQQGELIRNLTHAKPVEAGNQTLSWDATTNLGLPAAPGNYQVRGVWFPEQPKINYLMKVGLSGKPPYLTPDDRGAWGGNLGPAKTICTNGKELLAVFSCVESPKTTGIQLMDLEGNITHRFTSFLGWDCRLSATMDDKNAYIVMNHIGSKRLFIGKYDLANPPRGKILCDIPVGDHVTPEGLWKGRWIAESEGIALNNGRLYVSVLLDDKLFVVDAESGQLLTTVSIPSPHGLAVHNGQIFLASEKTVIQLDADGKPVGTPVISGLEAPSGLATDAAGNFYVADGGNAQQVKVFTATGKPLREIGMKGGRPRNGIYNPAGLLDPRGLCVTPEGKVWVASNNDDFQEITVWDKDGKRDKVFYNIYISSGLGRLSPDHTELLAGYRALCGSTPDLTSYKLDYERGTWAPNWHLDAPHSTFQQNDVFLGYRMNPGRPSTAFDSHSPYLSFEEGMVTGTNGKTYLVGGDFSIWLFDPATKQTKLASLVYTHRAHKLPDGPYEGDYDQGPNSWLTWADTNGDGKMALDEIRFTEKPALMENVSRLFGWQLEPDLSILMLVPEKIANAPIMPGKYSVLRLSPRQVLPNGVPVYDWSDVKKVVELQVPDFKGGDGGFKDPFRVEMDHFSVVNGAVYVKVAPGTKTKLKLTGIDGDGWWASRNWRMTPMKFDLKTGQPAWLKLGNRAPGLAKPGEMYYPGWGLAGSVDGISYYADTMSQVWAWTDDGLFLGNLYHEGGNTFDADSLAVELVGSFVYKVNGKPIILTGDHGVSVHEIKIPKLTPLNLGTVNVTPEMAKAAKPWDPDGPAPGKRPTYIARSIFDFDNKVQKQTRTITIDGKLDPAEWNGVASMPLLLDGKNVGTVRVTFDKTNLYLAYEVQDANALKNDGHELPYSPFVSGAYVDFCIGSDWTTPNRDKNTEGDVRGILAKITNGADYQMGYWPIKKEMERYTQQSAPAKKNNPQTIVSPAQKRDFDDIDPIPGLTFAYQITPKGYTLEAQVPFGSLGINPARQSVVGFDASVGFSDPAGRVRTRAIHWTGESEAVVVDRPGSAELKPSTWGTLQFDRTPLP